jgi:hypothetical protein
MMLPSPAPMLQRCRRAAGGARETSAPLTVLAGVGASRCGLRMEGLLS